MDMSFALQAMSAQYMLENGKNLDRRAHQVPAKIDNKAAGIKLKSLNTEIDKLTSEQ
jgi:adenosylhomocysteinase